MADNKRKRRSNFIPMLLAVLAIALIVGYNPIVVEGDASTTMGLYPLWNPELVSFISITSYKF